MKWYFQTVHHGLWDWDIPAPPNLVTIRVNGQRIDAVAQVTKRGDTFVFDRVTGKPVWPIVERPVPADSDVPGEKPYPTQPFPSKPPSFVGQGVLLEDANSLTPEIRAMALNKIYAHVAGDERLRDLAIQWLGDTNAPMVLRQEALQLAAELSFSSMAVFDVYQKLLDDPDLQFRVFAFTQLTIHGDARAQQKLIAGLENPETAPLPAPTAIGILSMAVKKEYLPAERVLRGIRFYAGELA